MTAEPSKKLAPTTQGALWMLGAVCSFSAMAVAGRELSSELDTFEMMTFRSAIGLLIVLSVAGATGHWRDISNRHLGRHLIRNIAHFSGQNLWFFALASLPLAQVFALEFTTPLWVILMAPLFLGEGLTRIKILSVCLGFVGILLVAQPGSTPISVGTIAAAASAIGFALTTLLTKRLTQSETVTCILFYLTAMQLVMGAICAGSDGDITWPTRETFPLLMVIAIGGLCAHFCITTALSLAPASVVSPVDFIRLPVIAVIGAIFYNEPINALVIVGALLIFSGNYLNILAQSRGAAHR